MNIRAVVAALRLPSESLVQQRLAKKLFVEHGPTTAGDRRHLTDDVESVLWEAELKSASCGVPVYRDTAREYLEIAVLSLVFKVEAAEDAKSVARITELVHRAIPYPVILVAQVADAVQLSVAHKRWALNEAWKTVLEGEPVVALIRDAAVRGDFLSSLALSAQDNRDFYTLYTSWESKLKRYNIADITGSFIDEKDPGRASLDYADYIQYRSLQTTIAELRAAARGEVQLNRRVEINLEIAAAERKSREIERRLGRIQEE